MKDYYQILGIEKTATDEEIKKAYRKLAHQYHPDKKGGNESKFKEINEAYQVLGNKDKRKQYDSFGGAFEGGGGFDFSSFWGQQDFDFSDIFDSFFSGFQKKRDINKGRDLELLISINLEDALTGLEKTINLSKLVECERCSGKGAEPGTELKECAMCRGTGQVQQMKKTFLGTMTRTTTCPECKGQGRIPEKPCNVCKGKGRIKSEEEIQVSIPAGVDSGQVIEIPGKGEAGKRGGPSGNLYVKIKVNPHPLFERKGDDLFTEKEISFTQAALGDEVEIETLEGKKLFLKVPQGTDSGKVFKLSGKGIPRFSGWGRGSLFVQLNIETPKKLTRKQKELLKSLKKQGL